jgi:predicted acylesterase/phospholipase RssA
MSDGTTPLRPKEESNVVGLSLSGGGIRSAAFCLGALQALRQADVLKKIDYLSTVSGGGYIGSSLSAGMTATGGSFPFKSYRRFSEQRLDLCARTGGERDSCAAVPAGRGGDYHFFNPSRG